MRRLAIILAGVFVIGTAAIADNHQDGCVTKLSGLSKTQVEKINQLEEQHQKVMDGLRTERRSTTNWMEKDKIRAKMLNQKEAHHLQLKEVLTAKQWTEFESLHQTGNGNGNGQGRYASRHSGNGHGNGQGVRGNGNSGHGNKQGNRGHNNSGHGNGNNNQKYNKANNCVRTSHTSNIDTNQYHTENFNIVEL